MWHVSISLGKKGKLLDERAWLERTAVEALRGVGGEREWWKFSDKRIGHLRVPVTTDEAAVLPPGVAIHDAGDPGEERARTY